jgi:hypothetical protein
MEVSVQLRIPGTLTSLLTLRDTFHGNRWVRGWVNPKVRTGRFGEALARTERKIYSGENLFLKQHCMNFGWSTWFSLITLVCIYLVITWICFCKTKQIMIQYSRLRFIIVHSCLIKLLLRFGSNSSCSFFILKNVYMYIRCKILPTVSPKLNSRCRATFLFICN